MFQLVDPSKVQQDPAASTPPPRGPGDERALITRHVPDILHDPGAAASDYVPSPALTAAVNVALAIGAPLLVTGDPGSGKTALAWYLAWYFGAGTPFRLHVKSTTIARDLLYTFDTVRYFKDANDRTKDGQDLDKTKYREYGPLWSAFQALEASRPAVVLIDEIDKAPRDFPNDLLHELDQFESTCVETDEPIQRPEGMAPPLVVITSNSERRLPEPFLRRCVFHHIEFDEATLRSAVARRCARIAADEALRDAALATYLTVRRIPNLRKPPSTAELLGWIVALKGAGWSGQKLSNTPVAELPFPGVLLKDREDLAKLG